MKLSIPLTLVILLIGGLGLSGCLPKHKLTNNPNTTPVVKSKKVGDTTLVGTLVRAGDKFFLTAPGDTSAKVDSASTEVDSYSIKFDSYVGKTVMVKGQYSGDTLFVSTIKVTN